MSASSTPSAATKLTRHCTHDDLQQRGPINLPVLADHGPGGTIRKSKSGRRRAIVLITVQLLMIAHLVTWFIGKKLGWFGGHTLTPVEPSESMQFVKEGVINAGLIFFSIMLLSTLVLGRWFCGWGCHIVMLQDFCAWIMKKLGVRPKPFRSRLLLWVPLLLALYMFVWPAVYRWGLAPLDQFMNEKLGSDHWSVRSMRTAGSWFDLQLGGHPPEWKVRSEFTTTEFWKTFPGVVVAVPFLLICGFATVYFLGAKGFCTYGCPYGGFFAPLDKYAAGRILVTDDCEQCGHCTAVCTSNVRVHDEVREYGMVVDPGCMKCLDCVSVCPNEALHFGFARPAVMKGPAKNAPPRRSWDLSWREEIALAALFALAFFSVWGVYGLPMLMAAGTAGITTFLAWKLGRVVRDENVNLHRYRLKFRGELQRSGVVFAAGAMLVLVLTGHSGAVQGLRWLAARYDSRITIPPQLVLGEHAVEPPPQMAADARAAIRLFRLSTVVGEGGIALSSVGQSGVDIRLAWLHSVVREVDEARRVLEHALQREGETEALCANLGAVVQYRQSPAATVDYYRGVLERHPTWEALQDAFIVWLVETQQIGLALEESRRGLERNPTSLRTMRRLSVLEVEHGDVHRGIELILQTLVIEPDNANAYAYLAMGYGRSGDSERALKALEKGLELAPENIPLHRIMAGFLRDNGQVLEADIYEEKAAALEQKAQERMRKMTG